MMLRDDDNHVKTENGRPLVRRYVDARTLHGSRVPG